MRPHVIVIAKEPEAGRVKTRLCPPFSTLQAAHLAEASFRDTIESARGAGFPVTVALEGRRPTWLTGPVISQRGAGLAERIANAFVDGGCPALLIGMDAPQISTRNIAAAMDALMQPHTDAVLGPAPDGGYWSIGLKQPDPEMFRGVPMSAPDTAARQRQRLWSKGLTVAELDELRDVDDYEDAASVAVLAPHTRFARLFTRLSAQLPP